MMVSRFGMGRMVGPEQLIHYDRGGVGEVQNGILIAGRDADENITSVQFVLVKADIFATEHYRNLLVITFDVFGELSR